MTEQLRHADIIARAIETRAPAEPSPHRTAAAIDGAVLHFVDRDYEVKSTLDLKKVGLHAYAAHPTTEVVCAAFAVDDGPVQLWLPGNPPPPAYLEAKRNPNWRARAHNDPFESAIEQHILGPRHGFPIIPIERHVCTMAMALALGLPARLSTLADALELVNRKDASGERLMRQMVKPRKPRKDEDPAAGPYWHDTPEQLQRFYAYNKQDVEAEREAGNCLLALSATEQAVWELTCRINQRGFHVDRSFALAARRIAQAAVPEIDIELAEITGGAVTAIGQVERLKLWLQQQGCAVTKLERKPIEKLLEGELPPKVRRMLELRLGGAQAAVKKIDSLLARAGDDDRVRGAFRYHGAATGRWAGEGFQPQNLKRPTVEDLDAAIAAVATGDYEHVKKLYPRPLAVVGDCSRSMITAAPGHVLIGADFSAIESRVLAWTAGEEWKIDSYRRFDATRDPRDEPYCETACKIFGKPSGTYTKESPERSVGKTCDLSFGYLGGLGAWRKFQPDKPSDAEVETFKTEWRAAHPKIRRFWHDIDNAAVLAVRERGQIVRCDRIDLKCTGAYLQIKLSSGRKLSYPQPRIIEDKRGKHRVSFADNADGKFVDCRHGQGAYGGTWTENIVSGIARDILVEAMLRLEAAGYPIILTVHDEVVCEVPEGFGSIDEFTRLMTRKPAWALDLPIAAGAWTGPRYCK